MKHWLLFFLLFRALPLAAQDGQGGDLPPRQPVPPAVMVEAQEATQKLVDQVVAGDFLAPIEAMHPEWKKKEAMKSGGMEKYLAKINAEIEKLKAMGMKVLVMKADPPVQGFEVDFGVVEGQGAFRKWMVFVPTRKIFSAFQPDVQPPKMVKIGTNSFMVAIREKSGGEWSFIDGSALRALDLRQMFPFLPKADQRLGFPPRNGRVMEEN
ncbi:MAG: hypothetical protein ACQKBY_04030 [Verrucomicrobiales bacterium]